MSPIYKKIPESLHSKFKEIKQLLITNEHTSNYTNKLLLEYGMNLEGGVDILLDKISFAMQPYYYRGANPTADCVIVRGDKVLLGQRKVGAVEGGKWAIPGGFVNTSARYGQEWLAGEEEPIDAALRECMEETALDLRKYKEDVNMPVKFIGVFEGNNRDPRDNLLGWSKSHAFVFLIDWLPEQVKNQNIKGLDDIGDAKWFNINKIPNMDMAFDHGQILNLAFIEANILKTKIKKNKIF